MSDNTAINAYKEIQERIGPNVLSFFGHKAMDYNMGPAFQFLGSKGQFGDINRKFWKLYKAMWLEEELVGEQPIEILHDLIGHCLLTIWLLETEAAKKHMEKQKNPGDQVLLCKTDKEDPEAKRIEDNRVTIKDVEEAKPGDPKSSWGSHDC